jgi:hypothetical protein
VNIGEEEEAIEMPMPLAPGQQPVHEPSPQVEPVKEPAKVGAQVSMAEREEYARCGRG